MSDTLQEGEDRMTTADYCDECKGQTHAPWCSVYVSADRCPQCGGLNTSRGKTRLWCNDCQRHTWTYGTYKPAKEVSSEHEPAARGEGDEITTTSDLLDRLKQHLAEIIRERDELRAAVRNALITLKNYEDETGIKCPLTIKLLEDAISGQRSTSE